MVSLPAKLPARCAAFSTEKFCVVPRVLRKPS